MSGQMVVKEQDSKRTFIASALVMLFIAGLLIRYFMESTEEVLNVWEVTSAGFIGLMILIGIAMILTGILVKSVKRTRLGGVF